VGGVGREVEEVDLVEPAEQHEVDRRVGAVAVEKEETITTV
jgi:hypothetical protein